MRKLLSAVVITLSLGVAATSCGQEADVSASPDTDASAQTMEDGLAAYERGDYSTALSIFQSSADQGVARGQANLAAMYVNGLAVQQDLAEAARLNRLAADQGWADAQFSLGLMYQNGHGVPQDDVEAAHWYRLAADQGHAGAQALISDTDASALTFEDGLAAYESADYLTALSIFQPLADQGDVRAQFVVGTMHESGRGIPENDAEAVRWFRMAADQGHAGSQYNLGSMYSNGEGVPENDAEGLRWYRLAADQGQAGAQYIMGLHYDAGIGVPQDKAEAMRWYRLAADQGNEGAQAKVTLCEELQSITFDPLDCG